MVQTNIHELEAHLRLIFTELLRTNEFKEHAKSAGQSIKENVVKKMHGGEYNYSQTGTMTRLARTEVPIFEINKTGSKASINIGDVDEWNIETKRSAQRPTFRMADGSLKQIGLRPEPSLPAWIIMEFGRREGNGVGASGIPKDFIVPYVARDSSKEFLFGPSETRHFRKKVFFMARFSDDKENAIHPGIKAGHFFRDGLKESQEQINEHMLAGLEASLTSLARKYGGQVVSS